MDVSINYHYGTRTIRTKRDVLIEKLDHWLRDYRYELLEAQCRVEALEELKGMAEENTVVDYSALCDKYSSYEHNNRPECVRGLDVISEFLSQEYGK